MLQLTPPPYKYCPFCSKKLEVRVEEGKERKWCPHCQWTYYPFVNCAVGAIIIKDEKVVLVKRNREPHKGKWVFPAGFVDYGEHPEETLIREVKEETGLRVRRSELVDILQNPDDPRAVGHFGIYYKVTDFEGAIKNNDGIENQQIAWFSINSLPKLGWQSNREIAAKLKLK